MCFLKNVCLSFLILKFICIFQILLKKIFFSKKNSFQEKKILKKHFAWNCKCSSLEPYLSSTGKLKQPFFTNVRVIKCCKWHIQRILHLVLVTAVILMQVQNKKKLQTSSAVLQALLKACNMIYVWWSFLMLMVAHHTDHGRPMTYIHCTNTFLTARWGMQSHLYFDPWPHFVISVCHKNSFNLKSPSTMNIIKYIYAVFTRLLAAFEQWLASEILSRTSMFRFFS